MGAEAIRTWGVGQVKRDNGAILFLFIDSRDSRIEVGYGLEGTLTDAKSKRILVEMRPLLRNRDYAGAVEQAAEAIIRTITPEPPAAVAPVAPVTQPVQTPAPVNDSVDESFVAGCLGIACAGPLLLLLFVWLIVSMFRRGRTRGSSWPTPPPPPNTDDSPSPSWSWGSSDSSSSSSSSWSSSDSSSSSSDSSSSSSDFSGGGGSGGGGGASDKW
jgi:uncharacterized protein